MDFEILILGSDVNAYYMARCYHEAYNRKANLLATRKLAFTEYSTILNIRYNANLWDEKVFLQELEKFSEEYPAKKILLISSNETYADFISKNKDIIPENYIFNYPDEKIIKNFIDKENFYKTYKDMGLCFPKTIYYDCSKNNALNIDIDYPIIIKPADVVSYNHLDFEGKNKIYRIDNEADAIKTITDVINGGYQGKLVIQEFIPGDDSHLYDAVVYSNKQGKVQFISFAQIGLQEHTKSMVGNAAVLINGLNTFGGNVEAMSNDIRKFLEKIGYCGFAEVDMKYDERDNTFKVMEINSRQGRCSYYVTELGHNLVKELVDDLIYNKEYEYELLTRKVLLTFVPKCVVNKYVKNDEFKNEAMSLWKKSRMQPLNYRKEHNIVRKAIFYKKQLQYLEDYKNGYWQN